MDSKELKETCLKHTMYSWGKRSAVDPLPITRTEGVYMYTPEGKKILDFNSQLMSVNIGHGHPKVVQAMKDAADGVTYVFPGTATEPRAKLSKKLAGLMPESINTFFFTLGGADANENAIRMARLYSGKQKILARYRSYHGGTNLCIALTGDPRRWGNEPGPNGIVHFFDPQPYFFSFGATEEERTEKSLLMLDEQIQYEGASTIAAIIIETVTGTNGILPPPKNYLTGLRALCDKYGILLICDEVMAGFCRTGKMFAFEHFGIVPDLVTVAKGLTASYVPLGAVCVSDKIAKHFDDHVFWGGLTYNAHAFCCEVACAVIDVYVDEKMADKAVKMGAVMRGHMERMQAKHKCVKAFRQIGLFGMMDLQNAEGELICGYNGSHPAMGALGKHFKEQGLFTFVRWSHFMCNPPLIISEEEMAEAWEIIDAGLTIVDGMI